MAATKLYDLAVKLSEYTDRAGQTKGRWQNVGALMQSDDGNQFIMLAKWFNPAGVQDLSGRGGESILVSCFEPKQQGEQQGGQAPAQRQQPAQRQAAPAQQRQAPAQRAADFDDFAEDIPF